MHIIIGLVLYYTRAVSTSPPVRAQLSNGQFFSQGLTIINAPINCDTVNVGSNLHLSLELSGNGEVPQEDFLPNSTSSTHYEALSVYLVNDERQVNMTVASADILMQEPGSTVKHIDYDVPGCVSPGDWMVMLHEQAMIEDQPCYIITSLPIKISGDSSGETCPSENQSPFISPNGQAQMLPWTPPFFRGEADSVMFGDCPMPSGPPGNRQDPPPSPSMTAQSGAATERSGPTQSPPDPDEDDEDEDDMEVVTTTVMVETTVTEVMSNQLTVTNRFSIPVPSTVTVTPDEGEFGVPLVDSATANTVSTKLIGAGVLASSIWTYSFFK